MHPTGAPAPYGREDQTSHRFLDDELRQLRAMSWVMPPVFFLVAAFLVDLVLARLIATERSQIGLLKAIGYSDVIHHVRRWSMGRSYSLDLRERVARHVAEGGSRREAGRRYGVSASTAVRIAASQASRGTLAPRRQGRPPGRGKLAAYIGFLVELVEAVPDITMPELARALEAEHGVKVHPSSISRVLIRHGLTYKKSR